MYTHLFGPVPSRRLGMSLGVDLVPYKTCSFDCVYCESGRTTDLTVERKEYVDSAEVISEIEHFLTHNTLPDFITFSGAGEPTLNTTLARLVDSIKSFSPDLKIALLTNSSLFSLEEVQQSVHAIDVLIPSLDTVNETLFRRINRPHHTITLQSIIDGLIEVRRNTQGTLWLEVFIIPGLNDTTSELEQLGSVIRLIQPDKVQLNTLDRPGTDVNLCAASYQQLERIASLLSFTHCEIIALSRKDENHYDYIPTDLETFIIDTLTRRPCTLMDLSYSCKLPPSQLKILLEKLVKRGKIKSSSQQRGLFYHLPY